jgi:hypothetical protein
VQGDEDAQRVNHHNRLFFGRASAAAAPQPQRLPFMQKAAALLATLGLFEVEAAFATVDHQKLHQFRSPAQQVGQPWLMWKRAIADQVEVRPASNADLHLYRVGHQTVSRWGATGRGQKAADERVQPGRRSISPVSGPVRASRRPGQPWYRPTAEAGRSRRRRPHDHHQRLSSPHDPGGGHFLLPVTQLVIDEDRERSASITAPCSAARRHDHVRRSRSSCRWPLSRAEIEQSRRSRPPPHRVGYQTVASVLGRQTRQDEVRAAVISGRGFTHSGGQYPAVASPGQPW